jgi:hypothetical protein
MLSSTPGDDLRKQTRSLIGTVPGLPYLYSRAAEKSSLFSETQLPILRSCGKLRGLGGTIKGGARTLPRRAKLRYTV